MLFPWHFLLVASALVLCGAGIISGRPILGAGLLLAGVFILTGYEGVEFNRKRKTHRSFRSFFLLKWGVTLPYAEVEKIFVSVSRVSQKAYAPHTNQSTVFSGTEYNGYVKFIDGTKVYLMSKQSKKALLKSLRKVSDFLNARIEDNVAASNP